MALKFGVSDSLRMIQNVRSLFNYLRSKNYELANWAGRPIIESHRWEDFYIQDKEKKVNLGMIFKNMRVCRIGYVSPKEKEILIMVYGKDYFEKIKRDLEDYPDKNNADISLLLDKEEPEFIHQD